ncbi:hypothetical protein [Taklimakanibacter deserti]|uniref:hypothetical protein n=1 Tax=Taklimakanibacter deserti TaxID=2267839 RepID=UPI000E6489D6
MPLNSPDRIEEAEEGLTDLQAVCLTTLHSMRDFAATSRAMAAASRKLITQSRQLLGDTAGIAIGNRATVYPELNVPPIAAE